MLDSVLYQDLLLGEGQGVEAGDSLEIAYTGWLFQNNGLGQVKTLLLPHNTECDSPWKEPATFSIVLVLMLKVFFSVTYGTMSEVICVTCRIIRDSITLQEEVIEMFLTFIGTLTH